MSEISRPDPSAPESGRLWHGRGYLPHFDSTHALQFITWRLGDSLPTRVIEQLEQELETLRLTEPEAELQRRREIERYLDRGYGECWLRRQKHAQILYDALLEHDGSRYAMHAFVIMPNHVHLLAHFLPGNEMGEVVRGWKDWSAHQINMARRQAGTLWQADYWDRYIRDAEHYENTVRYIRMNPVKAGLVKNPAQWRWTWLAEWLK